MQGTPEQDPIAAPEPPAPAQHRWIVGAMVSALLGLLLYLAVQYTGPSTVTDERLEAEALQAVENGKAAEAAERYAELASRARDTRERAAWLLEEASALVQAEQAEAAVTVLREASALEFTDEDLQMRLRLRLASLLQELGQTEAAIEVFEAITAAPSTSPEYLAVALVGVCDARTAANDPEGGKAALVAALSAYPDNPETVLALGERLAEILAARDRGVEADALLSSVPTEGWPATERAAWLLTHARVLDELREFDRALVLYDQALAVVGGDDEMALPTRYEVACLRFRRGDLAVAREQLVALDVDGSPHDLRGNIKLQLAEVLRRLGEGEAARVQYRAVIEGWPDQEELVGDAREGLGALLAGDADQEAIEALLASVRAGGAAGTEAQDVLLGRGHALLEREQTEDALDTFTRLREAVPDGSPIAVAADQGRADALIRLDRNTDAIEVLRSLPASLSPEQRLVVDAQIGETLLASGQLDEADAAFRSLAALCGELGRPSTDAELGLAGVAEAREQSEEALHLYQKIATSPVDTERRVAALQGQANLLLQIGRDEEAMIAYHALVSLLAPDSPTLVAVRMSIAEIYARRGDFSREGAIWDELLGGDLSPEARAQARIRKVEIARSVSAEAQDRRGLERALASFEALAREPDLPDSQRPDVVFGQAACLVDLGRYADAVRFIETALAEASSPDDLAPLQTLRDQALAGQNGAPMDPDLPSSAAGGLTDEQMERLLLQVAEAGALRDRGEYAEALDRFLALQRTIEDRPTQASIAREIAQTQAASGDGAAARATLGAAMAAYPEIEEATFLCQLTLADLDLRDGDSAAALQRLGALKTTDPGLLLWHLEALARAQATAGDTAAALKTWREAIESAEGDPEASVVAWSGLGDLYLQLGEPDRASDAFQRASVLAPEGPTRDQARLRAAQVALERGDLPAAEELLTDLQREVQSAEGKVQVALALASLRQEQGAWQAGLDTLKGVDATAVGPEYQAQIADARGVCLLALGRLAEAGKIYAALAQRWPDDPEARAVSAFGTAECQAAGGNLDAAVATYEAFVAGSGDRFRQGQALLRMAQLLDTHGEADRAARVFERVRDDYADQPELAAAAIGALDPSQAP